MSIFRRTLSLQTTIAIVIGGIIGSGIFMKPSVMAAQVGSPWLLLTVWVVAGIITLFGALSNAEVATMFPETGGQFVFFQKMYGSFFSFIYGWAAFAVFNTAGNASIAYVCSEYANFFLHLPRFDAATEQSFYIPVPFIGKLYVLQNIGVKLLTIILILIFTFINCRSVQFGGAVQRLLTALKLIAMGILIFGLLGSGKGSFSNFNQSLPVIPTGLALLSAFMAAVAGAFWAYEGWNNITFIAGEIKDPQKNIPKSLMSGLFACIIVYALTNVAFIYVLPVQDLSTSSFVASDAASVAWGIIGGGLIALMVILSTLGTTNANVLATARVTYAWCADSRLFGSAGKAHSKFNTPSNALLLNAAWSCILILSGSFDMLTDMLIFVSWFFYMMSGIGLFVLRKKFRNAERPYKVIGYPVVPVIFILFAAAYLVVTLYTDISNYVNGRSELINSVFGLLITIAGVPLYFYSKRKLNRERSVQVGDTTEA